MTYLAHTLYLMSLSCYNVLNMTKLKSWPYDTVVPKTYYYRSIQLYPVTDSSTWPFPTRSINNVKFQEAIQWLCDNSIATFGHVDYANANTQTVQIKFTDEMDIVAFTLQFSDLLVH